MMFTNFCSYIRMQWIQLLFFKMNVMRHFIVLVLFALVNINAYHRAGA